MPKENLEDEEFELENAEQEVEEEEDEDEEEYDFDWEKKARSDGWRPEKDFKPKPGRERWIDAREFVERGRIFDANSQLKRQNDSLSIRLHNLESDYKGRMESLEEYFQHDTKRQLADLKNQIKEAAAEGDDEKVEQLFDKSQEIKNNKVLKKPAQQPQQKLDPLLEEFMSDNDWMADKDDARAIRMIEVANQFNGKSARFVVRKLYQELDRMESEETTPRGKDMEKEDLSPFRGNRSTTKTRTSKKSSISMDSLTPSEMDYFNHYGAPRIKSGKAKEADILQTISDARSSKRPQRRAQQ